MGGRNSSKSAARGSKTHGHDHAHGADHAHAGDSGGPSLHRKDARAHVGAVGAGVITVSSTRNEATDESGALLTRGFEKAGHLVHYYKVVRDDIAAIQAAVRAALATPGVDIVVTSGGTGMARADVTIEAVAPLLEKRADGWGDVFRELSVHDVGTGAFLSRSIAGTVGGQWVVAIPGSPGAARTALAKLLLPELEHMLWEARR